MYVCMYGRVCRKSIESVALLEHKPFIRQHTSRGHRTRKAARTKTRTDPYSHTHSHFLFLTSQPSDALNGAAKPFLGPRSS